MFVISQKEKSMPIKVWLNNIEDIEEGCLEQARRLSKLPFIHKWVALMPDTHMGKGMPIGGVIATNGVIIPNAVGADIGCGVAFVQTQFEVNRLKEMTTPNGNVIQSIVGDILRNIPVGFTWHKKKQDSYTTDIAMQNLHLYEGEKELLKEIKDSYHQIGTLGGGNHFIELQENEEGKLAIMIHSGSRHLGNKVCNYFHKQASELNRKWYSEIPDEYKLAFLPVDSKEGQAYLNWMNFSLDFAKENREKMMSSVIEIINRYLDRYFGDNLEIKMSLNCHHNYVSLENHYGSDVWVHRKGAIRVRKDEYGIIPGAMGISSYIVKGLETEESFNSCSHGAGRRYSRTAAKKNFSVESVINDLKDKDIILGKHKKSDVAEESCYAYKDIEEVIENERDLVEPIMRLVTVAVVKG